MSITLENITHVYMANSPFEQVALKEINLEINRGEFIGIIGHTGSGKSTLMQHLSGILKPTTGKVLINGHDINAKNDLAKEARRSVGMVFQYPEHQLFEETVYKDIAFGPSNQGLSANEIKDRVEKAMEFVGLDSSFAERSPFQLSGGQMRRVAIAGVIALRPEYLILDEPSAGLDPCGRDEIFGQIVDLHQKTGITVILVSHNMEDIARMASRVIVMNNGQISLDGKPAEIFKNHGGELKAAGVDVPPITSLMKKIKQSGLSVDETLLNIDEAANNIMTVMRRASC